ncbi:helix-turn-helix domain-containing protein [Niallia endozanthoxylica]|uniref:helix-turn-helix domain-containing protein n=1 Tax=Niallia endozanthoxylica TaxID=2036016 RepID=UPI001CC6E0A0|nr:helix-turn-helix domain-containing protein [Niallia endozanthoxylica]
MLTTNYSEIEDQLILPYHLLKIAIFEETKYLFQDRPSIIEKWFSEAYQMTEDEIRNQYPPAGMSPSFKTLYVFLTEGLYFQKHITKGMIKEAVQRHSGTIQATLSSFLYNEFHEEVNLSLNEKTIDQAMEQDYLYTSMDNDYHMIRNIVAKKKEFKERGEGQLAADLIDNKGNFRGMAELRPTQTTNILLKEDQEDLWMKLVDSAYNSLDEWTADLFDLITYLWLLSPKNSEGYIEFHSNDALRLRHTPDTEEQTSAKGLIIRERDRFNIMKRVVALSSMWVSLSEGKIITQEDKQYDFQDFKRMFDIGAIRVAYDKKTGEAQGVYALQIKPTAILTPLISASSQMIGLLHLKVFQYSHQTQKEHKRLLRYIDRQWKMRIRLKSKLTQPFKIATLLKEMDIPIRYNWSDKKDKLENVLDDFKSDGVIKDWEYKEVFDESIVGKKGWYKDWINYSISIYPTDDLLQGYKKNVELSTQAILDQTILEKIHPSNLEGTSLRTEDAKIASSPTYAMRESASTLEVAAIEKTPQTSKKPKPVKFQQQAFDLDAKEEITLSPETMGETIQQLNMSIRQAAEEIGIAHTTLSRYLRKENKRQNNKNDEKMLNWLKGKTLINT